MQSNVKIPLRVSVAWLTLGLIGFNFSASSNGQEVKGDELRQSLLGAWALAGPPGTTAKPGEGSEMKVWGLKHFFVTKRDPDSNEISYHHGGTYTLNGNDYTETVRFAIGQTEFLVGQSFSFKIEVDGDTYIQKGVGNPYSQQWLRLTNTPDSSDTLGSRASDEGEIKISFEVPTDASINELFAFMSRTTRTPPKQRSREAIIAHAGKVFPAVIEAADQILNRSEDDDELSRAIEQKLDALSTWSRYQPDVKSRLEETLEEVAKSEQDVIAKVGQAKLIEQQPVPSSRDEAEQRSEQALDFLDRFGADQKTYRMAARVSSMISYTKFPDVAADLNLAFAKRFRESDDPKIQAIAERFEGTARRIRLLGNEMDLSGTTGDGEPFRWDQYRGKVVLVDFWASWCGPCIGEIPNMKRNLEEYGGHGFAIVGINMDNDRAAFEKGLEKHEVSWVNLFSEDENEQGWDAPMARYYGVSSIPTAILIDRDGKAVSLNARGAELDKQLAQLFPKVAKAEQRSKLDSGSDSDSERVAAPDETSD